MRPASVLSKFVSLRSVSRCAPSSRTYAGRAGRGLRAILVVRVIVLAPRFAALAIACDGSLAASAEPARPGSEDDGLVWRVANRCGANALYIALRLHDRQVSYQDVTGRLRIGSRGAKLTDLRDAAVSFGVDARAVRADPASLRRCPLPCIAHLEEERSVTGHYVVITAVDDHQIECIDGTTVVTTMREIADFSKEWTGYLVIIRQRGGWQLWLYLLAAGLGTITIVLAARRREWRAPGRGEKRSLKELVS